MEAVAVMQRTQPHRHWPIDEVIISHDSHCGWRPKQSGYLWHVFTGFMSKSHGQRLWLGAIAGHHGAYAPLHSPNLDKSHGRIVDDSSD